jgi:hypothetical protein
MKLPFSFLSALTLCTAALLIVCCTKQPIVITSPAAGAKLLAGDTVSVQWTPSIASPKVSFNYNLASSAWDTFTTVIPVSSQEVKVAIPTTWFSDSFQVKVEDNDGAHAAGVTGYLQEKYIFLTNALGGQTFHVGNTVVLNWRINPAMFTSLEVMLSIDSGNIFNDIPNNSLSPSNRSFTWVVGSETGWNFIDSFPSSKCRIQIRDYIQRSYKDISGMFTVAVP